MAEPTTIGPPSITIRPATPGDADALARLRYRFRTELGAPAETEPAFVGRAGEWFAARLAGAGWRGWVAEDDSGELVGHVFLQLIEKIPNPLPEPESIGYLTNCYVVPAWRNHGAGGRLLAAALAACDQIGVDGVILWPTAESVDLYRRLGFAPPAKLLERPLRPRREPG